MEDPSLDYYESTGPKGDRARRERLRRLLTSIKKSHYSKFIHTRKIPMKESVPSGLGISASTALRTAGPRYSHHLV